MSFFPTTQIEFSDSASVDAFNRLRISSPTTLLESKLIGDADPLKWDDQTLSGSTPAVSYSADGSYIDIKVSGSTTGVHVRQTRERAIYHPGKSQLVYMTFVLNAAATGITRRVGYFDDNNGLFLEQAATGLRFVTRSNVTGSPVDTVTASDSWSVDKFDGSGPSGKTLDPTKGQILFIDFEWLSVGRVRWGFVIDGKNYIAHQDNWANSIDVPYMGVPNLPCRYEIRNDGTGVASELRCICSSVSTEGGTISTGAEHSEQSDITGTIGTNTTIIPVLTLRKKSGFDGVQVVPSSISVLAGSAINFRWGLYLIKGGIKAGSTALASGGWTTWVGVNDSAIEVHKDHSGNPFLDPTSTDVVQIRGGVAEATNQRGGFESVSDTPVSLGIDILGNQDYLCLGIYPYAATNNTWAGGINWSEIR